MDTFITAHEANILSKHNSNPELNEIMDMINQTCLHGKFEMYLVNRTLKDQTIKYLQQNGFKVKPINYEDCHDVKINWM